MYADHMGVRTWHQIEDSVLAPSRQAYIDYLLGHGYALHNIGHYLACLAHFSRWLTFRHVGLDQINEELIRQFISIHLPDCDCPGPRVCAVNFTRAALKHQLKMLRAQGRIRPRSSSLPSTIVDELRLLDAYPA